MLISLIKCPEELDLTTSEQRLRNRTCVVSPVSIKTPKTTWSLVHHDEVLSAIDFLILLNHRKLLDCSTHQWRTRE